MTIEALAKLTEFGKRPDFIDIFAFLMYVPKEVRSFLEAALKFSRLSSAGRALDL